jgi:hypothetical protein
MLKFINKTNQTLIDLKKQLEDKVKFKLLIDKTVAKFDDVFENIKNIKKMIAEDIAREYNFTDKDSLKSLEIIAGEHLGNYIEEKWVFKNREEERKYEKAKKEISLEKQKDNFKSICKMIVKHGNSVAPIVSYFLENNDWSYLDFENQEKGYESLDITRDSFKENIGKQICYVNSRRVDKHRGYYNVEYGIISGVRYNRLFLNDYNEEIDIRDIAECGIKINLEK